MFFVRTATERDLPAISKLLSETSHATYDALYDAEKIDEISTKWHSVAALKANLAGKNAEFLVADNGKTIGGMAYAAMSETLHETAVLHQLYVLPAFQRQGIGRDLFAELETCFPYAGRMRLEVEENNAKAIAFYEAHGFAPEGSGSPHWGIETIAMEKTLD
ncbi:ribosomal protein S18 acetylase RimI-like enzyme [Pararhizobium capsulatum DSM 1112]|uniref:Ribosomal protein S18 acetylase RimI-like enzyme n=1 Tax=Pararhizobium capsulatum DSM 1112 TaxID=1121113 RepID=A0ABU0BQ21_9HYPH|nr:GNAT family N-acetyltransferase [Pararhizobium capsulatum]MDQ0320337.1 ribosomal protein S18 acetylase RimI-like enzyme [Pararhizobium capsulatum DSM 1112]